MPDYWIPCFVTFACWTTEFGLNPFWAVFASISLYVVLLGSTCSGTVTVVADTPSQCWVEVGDSTCEMAARGGGHHFQKGGCAPIIGVTLLSLPGLFAAESKAMVPWQKMVECSLRVGSELLPQAKEFKYLGVLFRSEGKMEREMDRLIGAASAVMRPLYRSIVVKRGFTGPSMFQPSPMVTSFG